MQRLPVLTSSASSAPPARQSPYAVPTSSVRGQVEACRHRPQVWLAGAVAGLLSGGSRRARLGARATTAKVTVGNRQSQQMNDGEILSNLRQYCGWTTLDMGAGGNCLFLSMASQVQVEDVKDLPSRSADWAEALGSDLPDRWKDMGPRERATFLRRMAILDESEFVAELAAARARGEPLTADVEWRTRELFTDMAEEFISTNKTELAADIPGHVLFLARWDRQGLYSRVREVVTTFSLDQICEFVLLHADEYLQITGREGNWAGSSEMAALSSVLKRPVQAYGNNWVSQDEIKLEQVEGSDDWKVLPYFEANCYAEPRGDAIRVFQTHGGGHYQMLS